MTPEVDVEALVALEAEIGAEALVEIIDLCVGDAPAQVSAYRDALAQGDYARARRAAHTLKSNAGNLGASGLAQYCGEVEASARLSDAAALRSATPALESRVASLVAELGQARSRFAR